MPNKHIFVGSKDDIFTVYQAEQKQEPVYWAVPASAAIGDQGFFLLPEKIGFYALGEVVSKPVEDGNKWTAYSADLKILLPLKQNVELKAVQIKFPDWVDVQHPRCWNRSFKINPVFWLDFYNYVRHEQGYGGDSELHQLIR